MRSVWSVVLASALSASFGSVATVRAQPTAPDANPPTARGLFLEGMAALDEGDSALAETRFRESFALEERASTALNLALVLQERGALAEAMSLYDQILSEELGQLPVAASELATFRAHAEADQATLSIGTDGTDVLDVTLDDELMGAVRPGVELTLRVDPGEHVVGAAAGDRHVEPVTVTLSRRQHERLQLRLPDVVAEVVAVDAEARPESPVDDRIVVAEPERDAEGGSALPYVLLGAGAVAVVAAVVITVVVLSAGGDRYASGPFANVTALTRP